MEQALVKVGAADEAAEALQFQDPSPTAGYSLSEDKKTATNSRLNGNILKTSRPLHPYELFKVKLKSSQQDKKITFSFGLVTFPYGNIRFPTDLVDRYFKMEIKTEYKQPNPGYTQGQTAYYIFKTDENEKYAVINDPITVGYVFAVVRKGNGDVVFQMNGVDLGVAYSDAPENILGYFETSGSVSSVEIV